MYRTAIISTKGGIPNHRWDIASESAYTKNRIPHKELAGRAPIKIMLNKDAINERENLRPFGQRVTCFNYDIQDKLSPRSYEARVIRYTNTYGIYSIIDSFGK
jgi:hypothetical protein